MRKLLMLAGLLTTGCSGKQDVGQAQAAVAAFHAYYNSSNYAAIADASIPMLKAPTEQKKMTRLLTAANDNLGKFERGKALNTQVNYRPTATFVVVDYQSHYRGGQEALEHFTFEKSDGQMLIRGYQITSDAFFPK